MLAYSLLLTAPERLAWLAEDLPDPGPGELLVATTTGAISIGSELPRYLGTARSSHATTYPSMNGYESVGIVIACGPACEPLHEGDRVVATYGHRTHAIVKATRAIPVPDNVSDALAILAILTCDMAKGIRKLAPLPEEQALITGAGAIGLLMLAMLRAYGVATIDVVEPREERRILAEQIGARRAITTEQSIAPLYSLGFECSSRNAGFATLQEGMQQDGRICILADGNIEPLTLLPEFHEKELRVLSSSDGWDYQQHARWFFSQAATLPDLSLLFQHTTPAARLAQTFADLAAGRITPAKVLVDYSDPLV